MKGRYRKGMILFLISTFWVGMTSPTVLAGESWEKGDPTTHQWSLFDLVIARPLGVVASVLGLGLFITSLPFTVTVDLFSKIDHRPAHAVKESASMFLLEPLRFSFVRDFPDENM